MKAVFGIGTQKIFSRNTALTLALVIAGMGVFVFSYSVAAQSLVSNVVTDGLIWAFGKLIQWAVGILGVFLINLFYVLIAVANYNQFLSATAVTTGWIVIRDLVNMFFVLVLIMIAIGTILQQQQYHYSQTLPKFLAAAILVNFSKTICGIFIDATQVVMMTFVGAISSAIGGNLASLLGIPTLLSQVAPWRGAAAPASIEANAFAGFFLALAFVCVALIVVGIMVVMLVIRVVALWFLIILSPFAFFLMALPQDRGYGSKWWDQFINYLLVGPVMMFFLWLSLTVVASQQSGANDATQIQIATELGYNFTTATPGFVTIGGEWLGSTGIATVGGIAGYILGICMLMATLMAAQQLSSVGGNIAGAGAGYVKDWFAGKRGPFNPFRAVRETIGGVKERYEKARKERVEQRVDSVYRGLAKAQQIPREIASAAGKAALGTAPGRAIREVYQRDDVQRGLDWAVRIGTGGMGGFGHIYKARNEANRTRLEAEIASREGEIGKQRGEADQANRESMDYLRQSNETNDPVERARLRGLATAARQRAVDSNENAERLENQVAGRKTLLMADTAREKAVGLYKEGAKLMLGGALAPITGGWSFAATHAAPYINELGKAGQHHVDLAEGAQAGRISEHAKKYADLRPDEIRERYSRGTNEEKIAALQTLGEKGELDQGELETAMGQIIGLGGKGAVLRQVMSKWADKYPLRNFGLAEKAALDPEIARDQIAYDFENDKINGKNASESILNANPEVTRQFVDVLGKAEKEKRKAFIKAMPKNPEGDRAKATLAEHARDLALANRDARTGEFNADGLEALEVFLAAGGQMRALFSSLNEGAAEFQGANAVNDRRGFKQIIQDSDLKKHVPLSLSTEYYSGLKRNKQNYQGELTQRLVQNTDQDMIKDMRAEASERGNKEAERTSLTFGALHGEYEKAVGGTLAQAEIQHNQASERVQNITNEINTTVNTINRLTTERGTAATARTRAEGLRQAAVRTRDQVRVNVNNVLADQDSSSADRLQANEALRKVQAEVDQAIQGLRNADNEVNRLDTELNAVSPQETALRAQLLTAQSDEVAAEAERTRLEGIRNTLVRANKDVIRLDKAFGDFLRSGISPGIGPQAGGQQASQPPPSSTP